MTLLYRCLLMLFLAASCAAPGSAQQSGLNGSSNTIAVDDSTSGTSIDAAPVGSSSDRSAIAPASTGGWFFRHYGVGSYSSPLGFGGRIATSLTSSLNLRAGASYFSFSTSRTVSEVPFTANVVLQSEQANLDWYPFHNKFHLSPGILFASSNRVFGSASIAAGTSFTINNVNYYSGASDPVQVSGSVVFRRTAPTLTVGWGNWSKHAQEGHWTFPFEAGVAFMGDPKTALNFSGEICAANQQDCRNIADDPIAQANIKVERKKLQNDADWARFYPIIAGGIVYRF